MLIGSSLFTIVLFVVAVTVIVKAIRVVPQQHALVVERLGRFFAVLQPGLNFVIPFVDRIAYRHDLREIPLDVPSQICITRDNTQLQVDGILYFQVTDPKLASYGPRLDLGRRARVAGGFAHRAALHLRDEGVGAGALRPPPRVRFPRWRPWPC